MAQRVLVSLVCLTACWCSLGRHPGATDQATTEPITVNTNFESGSLGKIEVVADGHLVCHVEGQYNHQGRNRQATWYYFRLDGVRDRDVTIELTDLVGEYNYRPGAVGIRKDTLPLHSYDNRTWQHFEAMDYDEQSPQATLRFRPTHDRIWIAHLQPYTNPDFARLLDDLRGSPHARIEVIGQSARGRNLHLLTVTNFDRPDDEKKTVWIMARQHAWETGSSFVAEGAIRWAVSDDPEAKRLRDRVIFRFTPMIDPDGVASGAVRYNANGYDLNRHWDEVDLRAPGYLERMPEIWYCKKAIVNCVRAGQPIALLVYLHNEEGGEWMSGAPPDDAPFAGLVERFFDLLDAETNWDPTRRPAKDTDRLSGTSLALYRAAGVPAVLMEQKIVMNRKLGRYPTAADRLEFGRGLARCMAKAVWSEK